MLAVSNVIKAPINQNRLSIQDLTRLSKDAKYELRCESQERDCMVKSAISWTFRVPKTKLQIECLKHKHSTCNLQSSVSISQLSYE